MHNLCFISFARYRHGSQDLCLFLKLLNGFPYCTALFLSWILDTSLKWCWKWWQIVVMLTDFNICPNDNSSRLIQEFETVMGIIPHSFWLYMYSNITSHILDLVFGGWRCNIYVLMGQPLPPVVCGWDFPLFHCGKGTWFDSPFKEIDETG